MTHQSSLKRSRLFSAWTGGLPRSCQPERGNFSAGRPIQWADDANQVRLPQVRRSRRLRWSRSSMSRPRTTPPVKVCAKNAKAASTELAGLSGAAFDKAYVDNEGDFRRSP